MAWGLEHLKHRSNDALATKEHRNDGFKLVSLGACALISFVSGGISLEAENGKRLEAEKTLQSFKTVTELSEEAIAGSLLAFDQLRDFEQSRSDLGERAHARVQYIAHELAYYDQPAGLVLALELSATVNGKKTRLMEYPTKDLFDYLETVDITSVTRFSVMNDIAKKPLTEVNEQALILLRNSQYLPAVAATTGILRRLHNNARPFLDVKGWISYLKSIKQ